MSDTKFKPGNPGGGRKPLPEDVRLARNMSYEEMCRTVIEVREMTPNELKESDLNTIPLGKRAIINSYVKLDYSGIKIYEDRLWGKAKESLIIDANIESNDIQKLAEKFSDIPVEEIIKIARKAVGIE